MLNLLLHALRSLFGMIDEAVYSMIAFVYKLLLEIANQQVFRTDAITTMASRVYSLLGIFMLFKLAFSLIQYIVNPDQIKDQKKGGRKLILSIVLVLVMIPVTPVVFQKSRDIQQHLLQENVLGKLILGTDGSTSNTMSNTAQNDWSIGTVDSDDTETERPSVGDQLASMAFQAFYYPENDHGSCASAIEAKRRQLYGSEGENNNSEENTIPEECIQAFTTADIANSYITGMATSDIHMALFDNDVVVDQNEFNGKKQFSMKYYFIISTAVGVVVLLMFVNFCIEVAVRAIKLGFLEMMAPIPIISYLDPKSAESGLFSKWLKMCITTYLSLFLRLISVYFAIFVIGEVADGLVETSGSPLIKIFLIIGALMFANEVPKMLEELVPSMKGSGSFTLNPLKTIGKSTVAAGTLGAVGGAVGGAAANAFSSANSWRQTANKDYGGGIKGYAKAMTGGAKLGEGMIKNTAANAFKGIKTTAGGFGSAGFRGMQAGFNAGGKGSALAGAAQGVKASNAAREQWGQRQRQGIGIKDVAADKLYQAAGVKNEYGGFGQMDERKQELQNRVHDMSQKEEFARRAMMEWMSTDPDATQYDARTFESFARDKDGYFKNFTDANGQKIKSFTSHEQYIGAVERYNNQQPQEMQLQIIDNQQVFNKFAGLENRTEFYNQEVRAAQKELGKIEKMGAEPTKKS